MKCPKCLNDHIEENDDMTMNLITLGVPITFFISYKCNKCGYNWKN